MNKNKDYLDDIENDSVEEGDYLARLDYDYENGIEVAIFLEDFKSEMEAILLQ